MATTVPYPGPDLFIAICLGKTRRIRETLEQMIGSNVARKGAPTHQMVAGVVAISLRKLRELGSFASKVNWGGNEFRV
jgi:hypothetical protein